MIAILSPAKTIDESNFNIELNVTTPRFLEDSKIIMDQLKELEIPELSKLMKINDNLAELNYIRNQSWKIFDGSSKKPAVLSFKGEAYRGLDAENFTTEELEYCNDNLRILSGLYGSLRPLDGILPYRLEMGTKLPVKDKKNLYEFWKENLTASMHRDLKNHKEKFIVNLASEEYSKVINLKEFDVITPIFKERRGGSFKIVTVYAKKARGMMVRYMAENRVETVDELKEFTMGGYRYNELLSKGNELVFTREE
ncbi:peroxide stress protein YaaA [Clostridium massiliamazoniense]|uniref:peroxide stress protein YaaA n=1 Tax=Clostridium massiliamazoniense TaxID=1347366 RepID=UPI0006D7BD4F|nr:peroxide stress protein YaaA [Clostridium massiliamazoniense]